MKHKIPIQVLILFVFALLVYFIFSEFKPRKEIDSFDKFEPDGIEMKYIAFTKNNQKSIEITCAESSKQQDDKMLMRDINATIFKKGKMDRDIYVTGDKGFVSNNTNKIFIEQNTRINSEDIEITSDNFMIKGKHKLSTKKIVNYKAKGLAGIAKKGMEYFIKTNVIKLFDTEGTYIRDGQKSEFKTRLLWIIDKNKTVIFEENTEIQDEKSILKSDQLSFQFDDGFKKIKKIKSLKKSYLYHEDREKKEVMEVKSKYLEGTYNTQGILNRAVAREKVNIFLKDKQNKTEIFSPSVITHFIPETGQISEMKIFPQGKVINRGKSNFSISANKINLKFKHSELVSGKASTNCQFKIDEYDGKSDQMTYNLDQNEIHLIGEESTIKKDKNRFISNDFVINTKNDILTSSEGIKSIITPDAQNALFSKDTIFIKSKIIEIYDKENRVAYKDAVRLQQNETILKADQLEILEKNDLNAKGKINLFFKNKEDEIILMGENLTFDSKSRTITINDNGIIKTNKRMLKAKFIKIIFDDNNELDNIYGEKEIQFTQENIQGSSEKVKWDFKKELMFFSDSAQIKSQNAGATRGDELKLDLKNNKITILADQSKRSETIIE